MLKLNEFLDKTGKTVSAVATISLGVAIISVAACVARDHLSSLFRRKRHIKAKVFVCGVPSDEDKKEDDSPLDSKDCAGDQVEPALKKKGSKKPKNSEEPVGEPLDKEPVKE